MEAFGRQRQIELYDLRPPGLHSEFQAKQTNSNNNLPDKYTLDPELVVWGVLLCGPRSSVDICISV